MDFLKVKLQGADERIEFIAENREEDDESPIIKAIEPDTSLQTNNPEPTKTKKNKGTTKA